MIIALYRTAREKEQLYEYGHKRSYTRQYFKTPTEKREERWAEKPVDPRVLLQILLAQSIDSSKESACAAHSLEKPRYDF